MTAPAAASRACSASASSICHETVTPVTPGSSHPEPASITSMRPGAASRMAPLKISPKDRSTSKPITSVKNPTAAS